MNRNCSVANYYLKRNYNYRKRYYAKCRIPLAIAIIIFFIWVNVHFYYLIRMRNESMIVKEDLMIKINQTKDDIIKLNDEVRVNKMKKSSSEIEMNQCISDTEANERKREEMKSLFENERKTVEAFCEIRKELDEINNELKCEYDELLNKGIG